MKIGIIGGGAAGLMAAWLLEQDHDVHLFEEKDRLGGHVDTVQVPYQDNLIAIEAGFEFFSPPLFPILCTLLKVLDVEVRPFPLTFTFYRTKGRTLALPPFTKNRIAWKSLLPPALFTLIQFKYLIHKSAPIINACDTTITMKDFADNLKVSTHFKENFLYPFYAGAWGAEIKDLKCFTAYDVLKWSFINNNAAIVPGEWLEIVGGASTYIQTLAHQSQKAKIYLSNPVDEIVLLESQYYRIKSKHTTIDVDHLIIATNISRVKDLIAQIPHAEKQKSAINQIDYFNTTIAVHGDKTWMPKKKKDWSIVNVQYDGKKSLLTIHKPAYDIPLFRSWIMYPEKHALPSPLYAVAHFQHAKVNCAYFNSQSILQACQGQGNLWLAGLYMYDIDSHDSALMSAILIAKRLAPSAPRLQPFLKIS